MAVERALAVQRLVHRYEQLDSPAVADAQQGMCVMHPHIRSLVPGQVIVGPAFTVRAYPGSMMTVQKALLEARPGDVLVVDVDGDVLSGAVWGDIMAAEAKRRALCAVVIDGPSRDSRGLREVGFPTFAAAVTPRLGTNLQIGLTQVPISCGGVAVNPGDWVFADDDGLVVIPPHMIETVLEAAEVIKRKDSEVFERVNAGENMVDILGFRRYIFASPERVSVLSGQ